MKEIIIQTPRSKKSISIELYNCDEEYLANVKKVICVHPANHSVALFLKMKDKADLCIYAHPLLASEDSKQYIISYTQKFNYPLVIITRDENIEELFRNNGCPTKWRRWCTRIFKLEAIKYFYKKFIPSGVIEYIGIQKHQSKERGELNPERIEDPLKSQKRYKIYRELPIFNESENSNTKLMREFNIEPFYKIIRGYNRYGCFLCPFAGEKYYKDLKKNDLSTYNRCVELMKIGSEMSDKRYYYYRKSKII